MLYNCGGQIQTEIKQFPTSHPTINYHTHPDGSSHSRPVVVVNMHPDTRALSSDHDGFGWLRRLPFGGLQLALFIGIATCSLVFLSILCVTLARIGYRGRRVRKAPRGGSPVPPGDVPFWSSAERISLVGGKSDVSHGETSTVGGLLLPMDADSSSDDVMAPAEFGNENVGHYGDLLLSFTG